MRVNIGFPVVRTDGRTATWLPNFLGWVDYHISLPHFLTTFPYHISLAMGLRPRARFARGWSSAKKSRVWLKSKVQRRWTRYIVESISLSLRISLLVIRTQGLGYWDDNNWKQVDILSFGPKWNIPPNEKELCFWLTWKLSPLKPRVRLKSKVNKLLGLIV